MLAPVVQQCPCCGQAVAPSRLLVDLTANAFSCGSEMRRISPLQTELLDALARRAGRVVTYDTLFDELWGNNEPNHSKKVVEVTVCALRKQLQGTGVRIETVHSRGYRLVET